MITRFDCSLARARVASAVGAALGLAAAIPAFAAEVTESQQLPEVVVTASKRATNLVDTPIALSVLGSEDLAREGVKNARDLSGLVPNLQMGTGTDSGTVVTMRGI